jgi:hypothetical protein
MKNKCSCYGGFDCVICNPDKYADTPRTDAAEPQLHSNLGGWVRADFARELELELAASNVALDQMTADAVNLKAEVERLSKLTEDCLNVIRVYCPTFYNDAMERFNKTDK